MERDTIWLVVSATELAKRVLRALHRRVLAVLSP